MMNREVGNSSGATVYLPIAYSPIFPDFPCELLGLELDFVKL